MSALFDARLQQVCRENELNPAYPFADRNLDWLVRFCRQFRVSADWLLGLSNVRHTATGDVLEGYYEYLMDKKGRVVVPAPFRERMQRPFVLAIAADRVLELWDLPTWRLHHPELTQLASMRECQRSGRILLPIALREKAGLAPHQPCYFHGEGHYVVLASTEQRLFDRDIRRQTNDGAANEPAGDHGRRRGIDREVQHRLRRL